MAQKLYADGYALVFHPFAAAPYRGENSRWDVTYYVIKLQMQKQIPTSLQAFKKRPYEMRLSNPAIAWCLLALAGERLFKT
ncbi:hypothetical protein [Aeromonas dhakensis]|uniref:hypothetical protein n=1 Tax=Aeromonas dhakensis TaxID=196024 RepID=UPI001F5FFD55|nr:hypothetical protein [Aeromonas dhakensis]UNU87194.1 hypothetical protein GB930_02810 [Aeromonas dhakensis]